MYYFVAKQVEQVLSGAHSQGSGVDEGVLAEAGVLRAWRVASGEAAADGEAAAGSSVGNRRPVEGDCPICFSSMEVRLLLWVALSALSACSLARFDYV